MKSYDVILWHLQEYGTITSWQAIQDYGITRLSEYIRQIRQYYVIEDEWVGFTTRLNQKSKYKKYIYKGEKRWKKN